MEDFKSVLFETILAFKNQKTEPIDWTVTWEDDGKFETMLDALDTLMDGVSLIPDIEEPKRINLLGRIALNRSHIANSYGNEQQIAHFIKHGKNLETIVRDIINASNWLKTAEDRFEEYVEFEDTITAETDVTHKQLDHFRPVLMALAAMSIITIQEEEYSDEDENDVEIEDEDECGEYCD